MAIPLSQKFSLPWSIRPIFHQYRWRIFSGILALLVVDFCQLFIPRLIRSAIDGLSSGGITDQQLRGTAAAILGLAAAVAVFRFLWRYMILGFSRLVEQDLRDSLFRRLLELDRAFFQRRTTGELMALATNDLSAVQMASGMGLIASIDAIVMTIAAILCMAYINPQLTLVAMAPLPLLALLTRFLAGRLHKRFKNVQEQFSRLTEAARSAITNIRLLKVYTQEDQQTEQFAKLGRQYISFSVNVAKIQGILFPASGFIANISLLIIVFFGGRLVITNTISIGDFVAFISYLFMLTWPMMAIGWVANIIERGSTSLHRIQEILEEKPLLTVAADAEPITCPRQIKLDDLSFTYPGQTRPVLQNITLTIEPGLWGIVGRIGSGKSTLCQLLARLYCIPANMIFVDDRDICRISLSSYRKNLAYVPQTAALFSDTLAANIAFGRPMAARAEIIAAAKAAAIHGEIMNFPRQYDTKIGEKGIKLSGGQRQRLALARAFLVKSPILLIDDGLAAVDAEAERHIMREIKAWAQHHIVIMVTHRLTPLVSARQIAVLENGRLSALGCHQELIEKSEIYKEIYNKQNGRHTA
ncbi:MAG: ABC transporter ATP-binding protein [Deltaproteobacteria bacterium]|nr:ABC transporter ATP-binding protein [Deltaproteobacteria bacterium]